METNPSKVVRFVTFSEPKSQQNSIVNKDGSTIYVKDANLIRLLSEGLQVQYEILTPSDGGYGVRLPGGNFTGMLGMITRSEADLAMAAPFVTEERYQAMNFTFPHQLSRITFMTDKHQPVSKNLALVHPFSFEVWITLFVLFAAVSLLFHVLMKRKRSLQSVVLMTFGSIFKQSLPFRLKTNSLRMLALSWILGVMILIHGYQAVLLSSLSVPTFSGIRDIFDLSSASAELSFQCFTVRGSYLVGNLRESSEWRAIGECLSRTEVRSGNVLETFHGTANRKAFVGSWFHMIPYANDYFVSEDSFFMTLESIPFSSEFCCPNRLNAIVLRIVASGLVNKIRGDNDFLSALHRKSLDSSEVTERAITLSLGDISGAFYVLMSGGLSSFVVLCAEVLVAKYFSQRI